ncbi:hypothetical protein [Dactylosporangium fulvum]|uniref:Phage portal protein n=1 Tax=Dactylosporangium fulvum TaxID=53359 RepID=A0ABY5W9W3_9ACTN|nr:hypothetical protein [Dactylosporangium fulvum]UWP85891.1 hypothetical protein Dfulv_17230 [Dactylosporangium fulvum]
MGRSRNRRRTVTTQFAEVDARAQLVMAARNYELAERRLQDSTPLRESTSELEQRLYDPGWQRFAVLTEQEFTDDGRRQMRAVCRLASISNPLLKRGLSLRSAYVHGQGVQITARANGAGDGEQDVQAVVSAFIDDEGNQRAWFSAASRDRHERALGTDGELYAALFTRPLTGEVQIRVVLADEITEIICNPEDRTEPWLYRRVWVETTYRDGQSVPEQVQRERLHPAVGYRPATRAKRLGTVDIAWDAPILHIDVNRPEHWQHGIPDVYAAINWARAYKTYLEQWATLMSALSRYAWRTTAAGSKQARQVRAAVTAANPRTADTTDPSQVGQMVVTSPDATLEAIPKSGATIDSESGRPLAMMVAAALDLPVTMLLGDPGQTGARAVAETLDQPTELAMQQRREVWRSADLRILRYVIAEAVRAPRGALKGKIRRDQFRDRETVELAGDTDQTIDIDYPDLDDVNQKDVVAAVTQAAGSGVLPPEVILRLLLTALGVRDIDTIVADMTGDDGEFLWPSQPGQQQQPGTDGATGTDPPQPAAPDGGDGDDSAGAALQEAERSTGEDNNQDDDAWQQAVAAFLAAWPALAAPLVAELAAGAERAARSGNLAALGSLAASKASIQALVDALLQAMAPLAGQAAAATVADAAEQGADVDSTPEPDEDRLRQVAAAVVALIAAGYASAAGQAALAAPASGVAAAVQMALAALAGGGLVAAQVRAAMSAAEHEGRRAVFAAHPPVELRASEHQDRAACDTCKAVDGKRYATLAEAMQDYPGVGGYRSCQGRSRCRGHLVGVWA